MKCALFTSGIEICPVSLRRSRAAKLTQVKKKNINGGVPGCQSLDEQVILSSNFHRDSFLSFPFFLFIKFNRATVIRSLVS